MTITKLRPTFTLDRDRLDALRALAPEAFADNQLGMHCTKRWASGLHRS